MSAAAIYKPEVQKYSAINKRRMTDQGQTKGIKSKNLRHNISYFNIFTVSICSLLNLLIFKISKIENQQIRDSCTIYYLSTVFLCSFSNDDKRCKLVWCKWSSLQSAVGMLWVSVSYLGQTREKPAQAEPKPNDPLSALCFCAPLSESWH